jgi:hypothetical protein
MAKAYVVLAPVGIHDRNGNPIPLLRGRPIFDAEVNVTNVTAMLKTGFPTRVAPNKVTRGYATYAWFVTPLDAAMKVVAGMTPNASTGTGWRVQPGETIPINVEEAGETLALVTL